MQHHASIATSHKGHAEHMCWELQKYVSGYPIAWKPKQKMAMASGDSQGNETAAAATNVDGPKVDLLLNGRT